MERWSDVIVDQEEKEKLEKLEKEREQRMHGVVDERARDTGDIQDDAVIVGAWSRSEA